MEIGYLRDAPWRTKGTGTPQIGFDPQVFAYKCIDCGYIELYAEKQESVRP